MFLVQISLLVFGRPPFDIRDNLAGQAVNQLFKYFEANIKCKDQLKPQMQKIDKATPEEAKFNDKLKTDPDYELPEVYIFNYIIFNAIILQ